MKDRQPILLILDVDETLVYALGRPLPGRRHDFMIGPYYVHSRPHLGEFLTVCSDHYDLAVWSSGGADYVETVVSHILPAGLVPRFVWSRNRCTRRLDPETWDECFLKDLRKVKRRGFDLDRVLIVEDTPANVQRNYGNAIFVTSYKGEPVDTELVLLGQYLASISGVENVRRLEKRGWRQKVPGAG